MNLKEIIQNAEQEKKAIGHFNIGALEQLKAIAHAAIQLNVPVIIGVSEGEREYLGIHHVRDLIDSYNKEHGKVDGFWLFLNADHTHSLENVKKAAEVGFDAILCDFGKLSLEENIQETKKAVEIVKKINKDILVEGELGYIGSTSEIRKEIPKGAATSEKDFTTSEDAIRFVQETGVDMLAPAIGNIHGMMRDVPEPRLDIQRIREIKECFKSLPTGRQVPLVLHGASGNTDEDIRAAIHSGISIVHISTEIRAAWRKGIEESLKEHKDELAPYKLAPEVIKEMEELVMQKLKVFGW